MYIVRYNTLYYYYIHLRTIAIASELDATISCIESTEKSDMLISTYTKIIIGSPITIALGRFLIKYNHIFHNYNYIASYIQCEK